jgi:hypothetical protein
MPIFKEGPDAEYWTCRDMLSYLLTPYVNRASVLFPILRTDCIGLDHPDWDQVVNGINGEGWTWFL